jgi:hypothetical protein
MDLRLHKPATHLQKRLRRLTALAARVKDQINDAECVMAALEDYCRENPDTEPCVANDPAWARQLDRQLQDFTALHLAVQARIRRLSV